MTEGLLIHCGVRPTPARMLVMKALLESEGPLSAQDIEDRLDSLDRSTITRTLPVLAEAHLIHVISDGSGSMKYEACHDFNHSDGHSHNDQHAHFHCRECGRTTCLTDIRIPPVSLPEGFLQENATMVISGLCRECFSKK